MCIYCDYCVYQSTELVSLYTLDIGLKINIIIIIKDSVSLVETYSQCLWKAREESRCTSNIFRLVALILG